MKWYGSVDNRLEENRMFCDEIKIGTGVTEYSWSDRTPYEVIEVRDQKHVTIRKMDHKPRPGSAPMSNDWVLISNPDNPTYDMVKRGKYWYSVRTVSMADIDPDNPEHRLALCYLGIELDKLKEKGKVTKYRRWNCSFGTAQYYYDYEF